MSQTKIVLAESRLLWVALTDTFITTIDNQSFWDGGNCPSSREGL